MTIGERIRALRIQKGWTQGQLAEKMGYSHRSTIWSIEAGKNDVTSSTVAKFAEIFGVTSSEIMGWGKPLQDDEYALIEEVCQDEGMRKRLLDYVHKLKEIKDAETS